MIFNVRRAQNFISHTTFQPPGGGDSAYERGGDARRLA